MATDAYKNIGYGDREIGFGRRPAVVVVDFQRAFTDPDMDGPILMVVFSMDTASCSHDDQNTQASVHHHQNTQASAA